MKELQTSNRSIVHVCYNLLYKIKLILGARHNEFQNILSGLSKKLNLHIEDLVPNFGNCVFSFVN